MYAISTVLLLLAGKARIGTCKLNAGGNPVVDEHPIQGRVEIFLVA